MIGYGESGMSSIRRESESWGVVFRRKDGRGSETVSVYKCMYMGIAAAGRWSRASISRLPAVDNDRGGGRQRPHRTATATHRNRNANMLPGWLPRLVTLALSCLPCLSRPSLALLLLLLLGQTSGRCFFFVLPHSWWRTKVDDMASLMMASLLTCQSVKSVGQSVVIMM